MKIEHRTSFSEGGGNQFVLSDSSRDRHGTRIAPHGWVLDSFRKNPVALFKHDGGFPIGRWADVKVVKDRLIGTLEFAAEGTSERIDELRKLVSQGILRAVSVGFSVIKEGEPGKSEWDFEQTELLEASLVSVGSNKNALSLARSLNISNETISLAFGEHAETRRRDVTTTGEHAAMKTANETRRENGLPSLPKVKPMEKSLSKRIEDAQSDLNAARDTLTEHLKDDNADGDTTETLSGEIEARDKKLASLKRAEQALASRTVKTIEHDPNEGKGLPSPHVRRPLGVPAKEPKPEDIFYRAAACHVLAFATGKNPIATLEERYGDHEATQVYTRASIAGATTTTAGWAAELVETSTAGFMESLRPISAFPRLAALGTQLNFGPNAGAIKIPSRAATPSISGSFVVEGGAIPVRRIGLTSITLSPHKMAVISVFTEEIAQYSNPQIEGLLRQEIQADTALTIDTLLIDAVAGTTTRPAGLTEGVSAGVASTSGGFAAIVEDINTLASPYDTANAGRRLALLMNPREARNMAMTPGPMGTGFGWSAQFMSEFNVIVSSTITAGTLVMVDAADFVSVGGTAPEFVASRETTLHMEDTTPLAIGTTGTPNTVAAPTQSMFQTASIALRMKLPITWAMRRSGMVQFMAGMDWAPVNP